MSSSINKRLNFSILTLDDLSHGLIEEILSSVPSSSALRSRSILASHLFLAEWTHVGLPLWNLEATIDDWVNLVVDDKVVTILIIHLLLS